MNIPGEKKYHATLARDNFWVVDTAADSESGIIWWQLDGEAWSGNQLGLLDLSLERITYFGRAEAITEMRRVEHLPANVVVNCVLEETPSAGSVPVLAPTPNASLEQVQATTDGALANSTVPPGAIWYYATRPPRPRTSLRPRIAARAKSVSRLVQFAVGTRVSPPRSSVVVVTQRFRGRVIRAFLARSWQQADAKQREAVRLLTGKEANGSPLQDDRHPHARFGILFDNETNRATRLVVWRNQPFSDNERRALLSAAERELQLTFGKAGAKDPWTIRLVPMDSQVTAPMGFGAKTYRHWRTVTPYVPPRHVYNCRGRIRPGESVQEQLCLDLTRQGYDTTQLVIIVDEEATEWARIHRPRRNRDNPTNTVRRGYHVSLAFDKPVRGPISLGHSSHFGLGLFVAVDSWSSIAPG